MRMKAPGWESLRLHDGSEIRPDADGVFEVPERDVERVTKDMGAIPADAVAPADEESSDHHTKVTKKK